MYGLVLEGGGARGSYHAGAYKAILEEGIDVQGVAGTSIGALNGAMIVQGDFDICCELWEQLSYSMVVDWDDNEIQKLLQLKLNKEDLGLMADKLSMFISDRGFRIEPFKKLLNTYIDEQKIRDSGKDFGIVTINLTDLKPLELLLEDIPQGELKKYILASAYLPVFKFERLGGKLYLDGGFYNNLPFKLLEKKGYKDLIIVRTHAKGIARKIDPERLNPIIISPSDDIGKSYAYEATSARKNIELGYYDGLKSLRGLKGNRYYIDVENNKDVFLDLLLSLDDEKINKIMDILKGPSLYGRRALFEYIVPKLGSAMALNKDFNYEDFMINLLERKAKEFDVERFKVYTFNELLNLVKCKKPKYKIEYIEDRSPLEVLIEKVDLGAFFNKENIISEVADVIFCQ